MSAHTPGPWADDKAAHDAPYQDIDIKAGSHRTVCTIWIDDAPVHDFNAEQNANARLIAAAPDLLEALEDLIRNHKENKGEGLGIGPLMKAKAAIAKAKGETP